MDESLLGRMAATPLPQKDATTARRKKACCSALSTAPGVQSGADAQKKPTQWTLGTLFLVHCSSTRARPLALVTTEGPPTREQETGVLK